MTLCALGGSFNSDAGFLDSGLSVVPDAFRWHNYVDAWQGANFSAYFINTVIVTVFRVFFMLLFSSMAGLRWLARAFRASASCSG